MREVITFDDCLIVPRFSTIKSRKDVDLTSMGLRLPVIASNMDTIMGPEMAKAMAAAGAVGCLHRFMDIDANVKMFKDSEVKPWVSVGLGDKELDRAEALYNAGAETIVLDVAHGANEEVVFQLVKLHDLIKATFVVGNFANGNELDSFKFRTGNRAKYFKVGIGGGSACTTRIETGCGYPTLGAVLSCKDKGLNIIADGGIRTPGDIAKALAAGASAVMVGGMLAGTTETPVFQDRHKMLSREYPYWTKQEIDVFVGKHGLKYRGSASKESYGVQGKDEAWRTAEGESFIVSYKGSVTSVLARIDGGLRSAYSYVGANNTKEFQELAELVRITNAGIKESLPHGKTNS